MEADRVTYEVAQWADRTPSSFTRQDRSKSRTLSEFDPRGGRELFFYYGAHLGSGVGTAAAWRSPSAQAGHLPHG
jgi:hypothetical protein